MINLFSKEKKKPSIRLFFSYSLEDEELRRGLEIHLTLLKKGYELTTWHSPKIQSERGRKEKVSDKINSANIILLLISPSYTNSPYCWNIERKKALERRVRGKAMVVAVILKPTIGWQDGLMGNVRTLPANGRPIILWENLDDAFHNVAEEIRAILENPEGALNLQSDLGPIDLNPDLFDLEIKRDANGMPLPFYDRHFTSPPALDLIQKCHDHKTSHLDLGCCGLTDKDFIEGTPMDVALRKCIHLQTLIFGTKYSYNNRHRNELHKVPSALSTLKRLSKLSFSGTLNNKSEIGDISDFANLTTLTHLDLDFNQIADLENLEKLNSLQVLNISNNQITELKGLDNLTSLRVLNISNNDIKELKGLNNLAALQLLDISNNQITVLAALDNLASLQILNLGNNRIKELESLDHLQGLKSLIINDNEITELKGLDNLSALQILDIRRNRISQLKNLESLRTSLKQLDLSNNESTILDSFDEFKNLSSINLPKPPWGDSHPLQPIVNLKINGFVPVIIRIRPIKQPLLLGDKYATADESAQENYMDRFDMLAEVKYSETLSSFNRISDISPIQELTSLQTLDLSYNKISNISSLEKLAVLQALYLRSNQISDIRFIKQVTSLRTLDLRYNKISDLGQLYHMTHLGPAVDLQIVGNPVMSQMPEEVIHAGWAAIRERLLSLQREEFKIIREVKLLLLGNTNVGKSSLLTYFETANESRLMESTHGIQYKALNNIIKGVTINCWDFGGQDYFHAAHQLFFSPGAINIVLWSLKDIVRREEDVCYSLDYWFRSIEQLIYNFYGEVDKKTEVIVCENKIDLQDFKISTINEGLYVRKFPKLNFNFTHINLRPLRRMEGFKELLEERTSGLCNEHSKTYYDYLSVIRASPKPFMLLEDFTTGTSEQIKTAMEVFRNMGILLFFPDIVPEKVFIKPQLLLDLLYEKVLSKEKRYKLSMQEIENAVTGNELGLIAPEVILLLSHFDLAFQIPEEKDVYFIPQYLPISSDYIEFYIETYFEGEANIRIESDHFLMSIAMLKVFSNYGRYVRKERKDNFLFWKDGIVIDKGANQLLIKFNRKLHRIELFANKQLTNFDLEHELVNFIIGIPIQADKTGRKHFIEHEYIFNRSSINWRSDYFDVFVSVDGEYFIEWKKLFEYAEKGIEKFEAISDSKPSKIKKIADFKHFLPKNIKTVIQKKVFISYAHADNKKGLVDLFLKELQEHLLALEDRYVFNIYKDDKNIIGEDWNKRLQNEIDAADIAILLLSSSYLQSEFIREKELEKFIEKNETKKNNILCPIYFYPFQFRKYEFLKKYQFFTHQVGAYGSAYEYLGDDLCYGDLVEFDHQSGIPIPNPQRSRYVIDFVKKLEIALKE